MTRLHKMGSLLASRCWITRSISSAAVSHNWLPLIRAHTPSFHSLHPYIHSIILHAPFLQTLHPFMYACTLDIIHKLYPLHTPSFTHSILSHAPSFLHFSLYTLHPFTHSFLQHSALQMLHPFSSNSSVHTLLSFTHFVPVTHYIP
jgi:hypothetical protein